MTRNSSRTYLALDNLLPLRKAAGLQPATIARATGIELERLKGIGRRTNTVIEPWLDEAWAVGRTLNTDGITPLITSGDLTSLASHPAVEAVVPDMAMRGWRARVRLPLTVAVRLTIDMGLDDPADLMTLSRGSLGAKLRQVWSLIEANERGARSGDCPLCLADRENGESHAPTCLMDTLMGSATAQDMADAPAYSTKVPYAGKRASRTAGLYLGTVRRALGWTQEQMASATGMSTANYSRVEGRSLYGLTHDNARALHNAIKVHYPDLMLDDLYLDERPGRAGNLP